MNWFICSESVMGPAASVRDGHAFLIRIEAALVMSLYLEPLGLTNSFAFFESACAVCFLPLSEPRPYTLSEKA